jgi:thiol-disulfide isomerase/thioredoxin
MKIKHLWTINKGRVVIAASILFLIVASHTGCDNQTSQNGNIQTGTVNQSNSSVSSESGPRLKPVPEESLNYELKDLDGKSFKLADYAGKTVALNLWASWCGPCRMEVPYLTKLAEEYKSQGVEFLGLTVENPEQSLAPVKKFVKEFDINYRIGWATEEMAAPLMEGNNSIPQTIIISPDSRIVDHFYGFHPAITLPKMRSAIERTLK